jgi:hypothetical protein
MAAFKSVPKHTSITVLDDEALDIVVALQTYCREFEAAESVQEFLAGLQAALTVDVPNVNPDEEVSA